MAMTMMMPNNNKKPKIFNVTRTPKDKNNLISLKPEIAKEVYCAAINVSDSQCATFDYQEAGMPSFWFPINEIKKWGHAPFLGTLRVVNHYYKGDKPVLIHCHAGANRSPSVAYAILLAKGYTEKEAIESIIYPDLNLIFKRNIDRSHIPADIIDFLKMAEENPTYSIHGILQKLDAVYLEHTNKRFAEQNDYALTAPTDGARLVYDRDAKRFVLKKD